jgi:hypothetical protein
MAITVPFRRLIHVNTAILRYGPEPYAYCKVYGRSHIRYGRHPYMLLTGGYVMHSILFAAFLTTLALVWQMSVAKSTISIVRECPTTFVHCEDLL